MKTQFGTTIKAGLVSLAITTSLAAGAVIAADAKKSAAPQVAAAGGMASLVKAYVRPANIPFPKSNPYTLRKAQLGKLLYFDPRLSRTGAQSCASCHNPSLGWGDGLPKGVGDGMKTLGRRSPTILNLAWAEALMWDGRAETLEEQALGPIQASVEMNMPIEKLLKRLQGVPEYVRLFREVFPKTGLTAENIGKAIATYERTVVSGTAPFDRWIQGDKKAISASAKRGFALFNGKARCSACHSSWRFTDDSFHDIGLPSEDIGRGKQLPNIKSMKHAFKTPGLRDITLRGPYMHDGSIATLEGVVKHYNDGFVRRPSLSEEMKPLGLNKQEIADLVAFMKTLTGEARQVTLPRLPR